MELHTLIHAGGQGFSKPGGGLSLDQSAAGGLELHIPVHAGGAEMCLWVTVVILFWV